MATLDELLNRYDVFLLDAFGVLVHTEGAQPGSHQLLTAIENAGKRFVVVTNDASRLPETAARRYQELGLDIGADDIQSSGMLLDGHFKSANLVGAQCLVLGPAESEEYVRRAGGVIAPHREDAEYDAVICCDDAGYPFLDALDVAISALFRLFDRGRTPALILPNPDVVYPKGEASYGFTAGGAAMLLEEALRRRYPEAPPRFERLGKPAPGLFVAAAGETDRARVLMVGDQLETDIRGALAAGIDALLVESGVSGTACSTAAGIEPTWRITGLDALIEP